MNGKNEIMNGKINDFLISQHGFESIEKKSSFDAGIKFEVQKRGYDKEQVEMYINELTDEYKTMYGEYTKLKAMREMFGKDTETVWKTMLDAQMSAKRVIEEAEKKAGGIINEAEKKAANIYPVKGQFKIKTQLFNN